MTTIVPGREARAAGTPVDPPAAFAGVDTLAVVVARGGQLPPSAAEAAAEAGGAALVLGSGAADAAAVLAGTCSGGVWYLDTGPGLRVGALAQALARPLAPIGLILLPASPDGRDLAPRLAAALGRPLLAGAVAVQRTPAGSAGTGPPGTRAELARLESLLRLTVEVDGPAVATLLPGARSAATAATASTATASAGTASTATASAGTASDPVRLDLPLPEDVPDVDVIEVLEPDPATMDLAEATRVLGGGAGLREPAYFGLLGEVAAALGASAGATRVVTDAGWMGYDRQIGTTGVTIDPDLYIAFGVSGASQHTGGLGSPRHVVSVNTDPSSPMTAMADLGLVTDAGALLVELARRLGVPVPDELAGSRGTAVPPDVPRTRQPEEDSHA